VSVICALKRGARVILAGDSLSEFRREDGATWKGSEFKVRPAGDRWGFALAGWQSHEDLNAYDLVEHAIAGTVTIRAALQALVDRHPKFYRGLQAAQQAGFAPKLVIVLAGLDDETGAVVLGVFWAVAPSLTPLNISFKWTATRADTTIASGTTEQADALVNAPDKPRWLALGDAAAARRLISMQIRQSPERCGPPIRVLDVDAHGVRWVDEDEAQENIA
jgi:hypothetical protein